MKPNARCHVASAKHDHGDAGRTMVGRLGWIREPAFDDRDAFIRHHTLDIETNTNREVALDLSLQVLAAACHLPVRPAEEQVALEVPNEAGALAFPEHIRERVDPESLQHGLLSQPVENSRQPRVE